MRGFAFLCALILVIFGSVTTRAQPATPIPSSCRDSDTLFGESAKFPDRIEIPASFTCQQASISGTIYLPTSSGPHPALVWVHGSGRAPRLTYGGNLLPTLVGAGIAVFSYDKRGVGQSSGDCCPGDKGEFGLLAADASAAVNVLKLRSEIDPEQIGFLGASQAGWVIPLAASMSPGVGFAALVDAPTVTYGEEHLYSRLTGEEGGGSGDLSRDEIATRLAEAGPSGFDPAPYIAALTVPAIWLYGEADLSIPVDQSVAVLDRIRDAGKHDFTVVVFPNAGHGLLDNPPSDPQALPTLMEWLLAHLTPGPGTTPDA